MVVDQSLGYCTGEYHSLVFEVKESESKGACLFGICKGGSGSCCGSY